MSAKVGGTSEVYAATEEVQNLVNAVRDDFEQKAGKKFARFDAVQYKSQVVAGTNFFVKVQVDDNDYAHLRVFRPLPHTNGLPELADHQLGKSKDCTIEYF